MVKAKKEKEKRRKRKKSNEKSLGRKGMEIVPILSQRRRKKVFYLVSLAFK